MSRFPDAAASTTPVPSRLDRLFIGYLFPSLLLWALIDAPRAVTVSGHRISALITVITTAPAIGFALAFARRTRRRLVLALAPLLVLLGAGAIALAFHRRTAGVESLLVYTSFVALLLCGAGSSWSVRYRRRVGLAAISAILLSDALYVSAVLLHGLGKQGIVAPRAFAAFALICLAAALGLRALHRRLGTALAAVQLALLAASLSRTAFLAATVVTCASFLRRSPRRVAIATGALLLALAAGLAVSQFSHTLHERASGGDQAIKIHGLVINTEGRNRYWPIAWNYFLDSPTIGHGLGAASQHIVRYYPQIDHPHNDYLRVLDDGGLIAGVILVGGIVALERALWRRWQDTIDTGAGAIASAAFLAILGVALLMITDNVIVYDYVMAPLGLLVGYALQVGPKRPAPVAAIAEPEVL